MREAAFKPERLAVVLQSIAGVGRRVHPAKSWLREVARAGWPWWTYIGLGILLERELLLTTGTIGHN